MFLTGDYRIHLQLRRRDYDLGEGYCHIALGCDDVYATCDNIRAAGGKIVREPGPMLHGSTILAFVEDPDGYKIELLGIK